jgi:acyl-CoA synthetase (AMP-forming)/AMP-acid ligase II
VLARNCLEWFAIYFGCFKLGAVPLPLNVRLANPEWTFIVADAGADVIVAQESFVGRAQATADELGLTRRIVIGGSAGWHAFDDLVRDQPASRPDRCVEPDDDLYQMYTSGTTGRPKGAVLTHRAIDTHIAQLSLASTIVPGDAILLVMPLFHAGAAVASMAQLARGAHLRVMAEFDAAECVPRAR